MKIIELLIDKLEELNGFDAVALVEEPAIEADFFAFNNKEVLDAIQFQVLKLAVKEHLNLDSHENEHKYLYVSVIKTEEGNKYVIDDTLLPELHLEIGKRYCLDQCDESNQDHPLRLSTTPDGIHNGGSIYQGIGVEEIEYQLDRIHFTPNLQTPKQLYYFCINHPGMGGKFQIVRSEEQLDIDVSGLPNYTNPLEDKEYEFESYNDYPQSATNAAKRALKWREDHPDNDCGTRVGWARANQLANRRNISEDTIGRMASFARHLQHEDVPYSEGCGGLMVDAWGGRAGIEWAKGKLERIRMGLSKEGHIIDNLPVKEQESILERLLDKGIDISSLIEEGYEVMQPEEFFKHIFTEVNNFNPGISNKTGLPLKKGAKQRDALTTKGAKVLFQYVGPVDAKTRPFCKRMMQMSNRGVLWSENDLENIVNSNPGFGSYNIFTYKGSYGCRHKWNKVYLYQKKPKAQKVTVSFLEKAKFASKEYKFGLDEEKKRLVGPMLIPNKLIMRVDEEGNPFYVYFSEDTVRQIAEKAIKDKLIDSVNLEHDPEAEVDAHMTSSWIVEDPDNDKSNMYGLKVPTGTWMAEYKVEDDNVWQMVKEGVVKGFSIEGIFRNKRIQ